jgi:two-component system LytT family response regulator
MPINTLIVDDVALSREAIRVWLSEEPDIAVVGEAAAGPEAVEALRTLAPDLVFLDIKLPRLDGFGVLKRASSPPPAVIFMTAYDQYAVKAFEANAIDYLLKPISRKRFNAALDRVRHQLATRTDRTEMWNQMLSALNAAIKSSRTSAAAQQSAANMPRFAVKDGDLTVLVRPEEIDWIEASDNYATLHSGIKSFLIRMTMGEIESQLAPIGFARISRSAIVNTDRIRGFKTLWHGDCQVHLRNGAILRLSRRYRDGVLPGAGAASRESRN